MKHLALILLTATIVGCGSSGPDPKVEEDRLASAKQMRELFTKAGGDYEKLSSEDHAALLKQFSGSEANAKRSWETMKSLGVPVASSPNSMPTGMGMPGAAVPRTTGN